jgi:hypothetical protein
VGSWYPISDSNPTGWELKDWNVWMVGFTIVSVASGIVIWFVSQSTRRGKTDAQLVSEVAEEVGAVVVPDVETAGPTMGSGSAPEPA